MTTYSTFLKMIDISKKPTSYRRACVFGSIYVGKEVFFLIKNKSIEKGDPLVLAEAAGINAIKNTNNSILFCHPINIENIFFSSIMDFDNYLIKIYCIVNAHSKTGVEMEAMCGVSMALLTIYDLTKKFNPFVSIKEIKLLFKDGGENGLIIGSLDSVPVHLKSYFLNNTIILENISVFLITVSNRASFGFYKDLSGQNLIDFFSIKKSKILNFIILPDDKEILFNTVKRIIEKHSPNFVFISGGTGLSFDDITPSVISSLCDKIIPGIGELIRNIGLNYSLMSCLSASISGIYKKSLIISLPGNPSAVNECLDVLQYILLHSINIVNKL